MIELLMVALLNGSWAISKLIMQQVANQLFNNATI
jgi:hypothetical protein